MHYDLTEHMRPRMHRGFWEHAEPMELFAAVNHISCGGDALTYAGWFRRPDTPPNGSNDWARYFLETSQGGSLTGRAMVFVYGGGGRWDKTDPDRWIGKQPAAFRVAICDHKAVSTGTQEQSRRGWHPAHCEKCGMDLSVDSGD